MDKKTKGSRSKLDLKELAEFIEFMKKLRPPMREYSTAGQWVNGRESHVSFFDSLYRPVEIIGYN